ncbi:hypothetical protein CASFOL_000375 [Castilleja foliolosa]|uniref:Uncharacterized protein n=1 Tax=Castilleja foliolosa TaxID=1961234 RepID=A0ABD3EP36_9LAMI
MKMPAAPNMAHLQWTSSACWFHFKLSGSDAVIECNYLHIKDEDDDELDLPSSHGGGAFPGNHTGLSGSAATHTATDDLELLGAANLLTRNFLPPKKDALVAPTIDPLFWELNRK